MTTVFSLLKKDHQTVKDILERLLETSDQAKVTRKELLEELKQELQQHEEIEEKLFYPALKEYNKLKPMILEAYEEHHLVDDLLEKVEACKPNDESWKAKVMVLKECLLHHIQEEENEIFSGARECMKQEQLNDMASEIENMKQSMNA